VVLLSNALEPQKARIITFEGKTEKTRAEKPGSNLVRLLCATFVFSVSLW
jgi:hypothetical protein